LLPYKRGNRVLRSLKLPRLYYDQQEPKVLEFLIENDKKFQVGKIIEGIGLVKTRAIEAGIKLLLLRMVGRELVAVAPGKSGKSEYWAVISLASAPEIVPITFTTPTEKTTPQSTPVKGKHILKLLL
jgi:hypothetical protein